jgi:hypothetical protein
VDDNDLVSENDSTTGDAGNKEDEDDKRSGDPAITTRYGRSVCYIQGKFNKLWNHVYVYGVFS